MKSINKIRCVVVLIAITAILPLLHGCATPNPQAGQPILAPNGQQATNAAGLPAVQPPNIPNATGTKIVGYANTAAPLIPAPYGDIVTLGALVATGVMKLLANKANATTNQLAASVVAQGPAVTQAVSDHASNNDAVFPAVAAALNSKQV